MINISEEYKNKTLHLTLEGDLRIQNSDRLKQKFWDSLNEEEELVLNLESVSGVDCSGLQLLQILYVEAQKLNKHVRVVQSPSKEFIETTHSAGFAKIMNWCVS